MATQEPHQEKRVKKAKPIVAPIQLLPQPLSDIVLKNADSFVPKSISF